MKSDKNIREGYKKTAVGVIPKEWEVKKLQQLVSIQNGRGYSHLEKGDIPVYASGGIINYVKEHLYEGTSIGIGRKGTIDNPQLLTGKYWVIDTLFFMNNFKDIYPYFLYSKFKTINWYRYNETSGLPSLIKNTIQKIQLAIPPLPEQQAIANCLTTWDSGIEKLTQLIAAKREQKKGLMQQLLTGKKRLDGFVGEWKEVKINEIAKRVTRKNKELNDTVITISAQRGLVLQEDFFNKRVASATLSNYYLLHKGEFAYNKSYSKGYPMGAFKRLDDFEKAVVTTLYICFKIKDNVNSDFLMNFFEAGLMVNNLMRIAQEGGRAHGLLNIGLADFFNLKLNIPSFEEQTAIAHILTTADQEISLLEEKLAKMKEEKKGLMKVLLTGEKRLVDN